MDWWIGFFPCARDGCCWGRRGGSRARWGRYAGVLLVATTLAIGGEEGREVEAGWGSGFGLSLGLVVSKRYH